MLCSVVSRSVCVFVGPLCSGDTSVMGFRSAAKNRQGSGDSVGLVVGGWLRANALVVV